VLDLLLDLQQKLLAFQQPQQKNLRRVQKLEQVGAA
jgi:hypothetical protein